MEWYWILIILMGSLTLLLCLGLPVAFSLGFLSMLAALIFWPGTTGLYGVALAGYGHMSSFTLVCVPLFILMAQIVMHCEMGKDTYDVADRFLRGMPGGLGMTSTVFGAIFGTLISFGVYLKFFPIHNVIDMSPAYTCEIFTVKLVWTYFFYQIA